MLIVLKRILLYNSSLLQENAEKNKNKTYTNELENENRISKTLGSTKNHPLNQTLQQEHKSKFKNLSLKTKNHASHKQHITSTRERILIISLSEDCGFS